VALGAIAAARRGRSAERYLLGGQYASLIDLAALVEAATGTRAPRWVVPMPLARLSAFGAELWCRATRTEMLFNRQALHVLEAKNRTLNCEKARRELDYDPRPLDETVRDIMTWERQDDRPAY
jgi:dihydroflavonol-4-reductase